MKTFLTVLLVILIIALVLFGVLYYLGRKLTRQQEEQAPVIEANTQLMSLLVVDKKKLSLKDAVKAGLPREIESATPFYLKWSKVPVVKAKVGPRVVTMMADPSVFEIIPVRKECKVSCSGIYIRELKSVRGGIVPKAQKKGFFKKLSDKAKAQK